VEAITAGIARQAKRLDDLIGEMDKLKQRAIVG
jgi:hypothetical protein